MKNHNRNLIYIVDDDPDDREIILDAFLRNKSDLAYTFMDSAEHLITNL